MPWTLEHVDRITAALGLPSTANGDEVAAAVRLCTRRCEELERKLITFQESHGTAAIEARLERLEAAWRPTDTEKP
jgi:hypothetical protein